VLQYAALIEVDNSNEDPDIGRRGLNNDLAPALKSMPGFVSTVLLTAYERGRGVAVVVFDTKEQAERLTSGLAEGVAIRDGVVVIKAEVLKVSASS
jgi:hypothetical protein